MNERIHHWRSLPIAAWPQQDRLMWEKATFDGGVLEAGGHASRLSRATLQTMRQLYGALLGWLSAEGDLDLAAGPAERLTPARYLRYLAARRQSVSDNTIFSNLRMLAMTMNCLEPGQEWGWVYRHPQAPRRREARASQRRVPLVRPGELMAGLLLRLEAVREAPISAATAVRVRDLLLVGICATTGLRAKNLLGLTLGKSISRHPAGYEIRYGAANMKNERPVTIWLMPELVPALEHYLKALRTTLLRPGEVDGGALWMSQKGNRLAGPSMSVAFGRTTMEVVGKWLYPHSLRHSAATTMIDDDARNMDAAASTLGHKDTSTTCRFYDLSEGDRARAEWRSMIKTLRFGKSVGRSRRQR